MAASATSTLPRAPGGRATGVGGEPSPWASHTAVAAPDAGPTVKATAVPDGDTATLFTASAPPCVHWSFVASVVEPPALHSTSAGTWADGHETNATLAPVEVRAGSMPVPTAVVACCWRSRTNTVVVAHSVPVCWAKATR